MSASCCYRLVRDSVLAGRKYSVKFLYFIHYLRMSVDAFLFFLGAVIQDFKNNHDLNSLWIHNWYLVIVLILKIYIPQFSFFTFILVSFIYHRLWQTWILIWIVNEGCFCKTNPSIYCHFYSLPSRAVFAVINLCYRGGNFIPLYFILVFLA